MYSHPLLAAHAAAQPARAWHAVSMPLLPDGADAPPSPPEWVHLVPAGAFSGRDGRGPYTLDAAAVLAAFEQSGIDLPIDYEHQTLEASDKAGPVPAAGWIKALEARDDGLWGRVEWTPRAAELIAAREYRFLSPVFRHDKTGRVLAMEGAGLVHYPNLDLEPVAHQKGDDMNEELLERLRFLLNLPTLSTPEEVVAELEKLIQRLSAAEAAAQARQPDPAKWVPMSQHQAVAEELARLQAAVAAEKAEAAVSAAMSAGKIAPAMKDWARSYATKDPAGFGAFVEKAPAILPAGPVPAAHVVSQNADTLTVEDRYVCAMLGIAESDFAAHKRALGDVHA